MHIRKNVAAILVAGALLIGCTSPDSDEASEDTGAGTEETIPVPSGPAPGVTDDSIKVGVLYVDLAAIGDIATLDHGDYETAYQAVFDAINADGGINGRTIDPVIVGVNPVGTESADAACTQLTQDEQVFVVIGFVQGDNVLCPLETHATAVLGGSMSPERLERAEAPWFTAESGTDLQSDVVSAMAEAGELDGSLGVYGGPNEEAQINEIILPLLDELGVEVTETAVLDLGEDVDITAANAATRVVAERFESSGVDQVLAVGGSGLGWATGTQDTDYRPQLLLTDPNSVQAYATDPRGNDLSILDGAVAGNLYGPAQNIWELPQTQDCISVVEAAGVPVPEPDSLPADSGSVYTAGMAACRDAALFQALVEAAGEDLNYGTLAAGADGLEVVLPVQPEAAVYGAPPSADGDLAAYLYDWDPEAVAFALRED